LRNLHELETIPKLDYRFHANAASVTAVDSKSTTSSPDPPVQPMLIGNMIAHPIPPMAFMMLAQQQAALMLYMQRMQATVVMLQTKVADLQSSPAQPDDHEYGSSLQSLQPDSGVFDRPDNL
jgi:hypothetical protein